VVTGAKPDTNFSHYDKLDDLIEAARIEIDPSKQIELWRHAQIMILQDMVAYPLHYLNQIFARRNYVDYGHEVVSSMALYPQITEKTRIRN
jgi:peptide/nickel transport system substrate-binding protein